MRGLTVIVVGTDPQRFAAALAIACAQAALGGPARLYAHEHAVTLTSSCEALETARALGVALIACQSGLAAHSMPPPAGWEAGGLVSLLAALGDDRLVTI